MATLDITAELDRVDFAPASTTLEILQNVRTILTTARGSVPMDRDFGIDAEVVSMPIATAQAKLTADIIATVMKYEPRAKVKKIIYEGDEESGQIRPTVRIEVVENA